MSTVSVMAWLLVSCGNGNIDDPDATIPDNVAGSTAFSSGNPDTTGPLSDNEAADNANIGTGDQEETAPAASVDVAGLDDVTHDTTGAELSGKFLDTTVEGLAFTTDSRHGYTDANGTFSYLEGEMITFHIGDPFVTEQAWILGSTPASEVLTPLQLAGTETINTKVINILRILQTLDTDEEVGNGIQLPSPSEHLPDASKLIDFSSHREDFETNPAVLDYVSRATALESLLDDKLAIEHFQRTLNTLYPTPVGQWTLSTVSETSPSPTSELQVSIGFTDDSHYSVAASLDDIELMMIARYQRDGLRIRSEPLWIRLTSSHQQHMASIGEPAFNETHDQMLGILPAAVLIAIGLDSRLVMLPNRLSLESDDHGVQFTFMRTDSVDADFAHIQMDTTSAILDQPAQQLQLDATLQVLNSSDVINIPLTWTSTDENIIEVGSNGLVTAVGDGMADVIVTAVGRRVSVSIEVQMESTGVMTDCSESDVSAIQGNHGMNESTIVQSNQSDDQADVLQANNQSVIQSGGSSTLCES